MRITKHLTRLSLLAVASTALVGALAGPSQAATATAFVTAGNDVHYVGHEFANKIKVTSFSAGRIVALEDTTGSRISPGTGCIQDGSVNKVICEPGTAIDFIKVMPGAGPDEIQVDTTITTRIEGGTENDTYIASANGFRNVTFEGGAGTDTADYGQGTAGVAVDMDGQADDGRIGIDHDNITTTVENLYGTNFDDSLRGNSSANVVIGREGADALRGGGGSDEIVATESAGTDGSKVDKPDLSCGTETDIIRVDRDDPQVSGDCETVQRSTS